MGMRAWGLVAVVLVVLIPLLPVTAQGDETPTPVPTETPTPTATATPTPAPVFYATLESGQAVTISYNVSADGVMLGVLAFAQLVVLVLLLVAFLFRGDRRG